MERADLLDRLLGHDRWTTLLLLERCRPLGDEELDRQFEIDHESVRALLQHMIGNVEVWTALMRGRPVERTDRAARPSVAELESRFAVAYADFADLARGVRDDGRINTLWTDVLDRPPTQKTYGGAILHVITHNMHHRAHLLLMLGRLGQTDLPEGDLLGWELRAGSVGQVD